jgi:hypothetical protein
MTAVLIGLQHTDFMAFFSQDKRLLDLGTDENLAEVLKRRNFDRIASATAIFYECGSFEAMVTRDSALCFADRTRRPRPEIGILTMVVSKEPHPTSMAF